MKKITISKFKNLLNEGELSFSFEKVNGELREARGTTNTNKIPAANLSQGGETPGEKTSYFDLDKGAWRSVSIDKDIFV
jgi:hypothetical protein